MVDDVVASDASSSHPKSAADAGEHQEVKSYQTESSHGRTPAAAGDAGAERFPHPAAVDKEVFRESRQINAAPAPAVSSPRKDEPLASGSSVPEAATDAGLTSVMPPAATAAPAAVEIPATMDDIPAAMDEVLLSYMYNECCPGMDLTRAGNLPDTITFVLMYVDPQDCRFFWAVLVYGNKVSFKS